MKAYYQLNKEKVRNLIFMYSGAFGILALASVGVLVYFFDLDIVTGLLCGVFATAALTAFLVLQSLVTGNYTFTRRRRTLGIPFIRSFFRSNDFTYLVKQPESKWDFKEEVMLGNYYGFMVEADIDEENPKLINFKFRTARIGLNKEHFNALMQQFKSFNATFVSDGVLIAIDFTRMKSETDLSYRLESFASMLRGEGFTGM